MSRLDELAPYWEAISTLLDEALALPEKERGAWLAGLQGERALHLPALRQLLSTQAGAAVAKPPGIETDDLLRTLPPLADAAGVLDSACRGGGDEPQPGQHAGPYRLIEALGQGGMGTVWIAERDDGVRGRRVALKLPRLAWGSALTERLARERDILAALEHPHIARLYDAGVDARGRPYLAMELVDGKPIDVYCREQRTSVRETLALLLQVCAAVAHAHARLVIHRDLKPANILVTAQGQVRLLDFGIAKLLEGDRTRRTALTREAGVALTLDYASPEQISGAPLGTGSDVYSLGVVAFELLAGQRPYRLRRGTAAELEEAIAAVEPPLASTAASIGASAVASNPSRARELRGDLDAILNQALKKNPADRYPSVEAFVQDIERWFADQPVRARPDSIAYRTRRFMRRHRVPLAAGGAVALALFAGSGIALWQATQARMQAARAESVAGFMRSLFASASPERGATVDTRAVDLLVAGRERALIELRDDPRLMVDTLVIVGESLLALDASTQAEQTFERALAFERSRPSPDAGRLRRLEAWHASALLHHGDFARADALLAGLEAARRDRKPDAVDLMARNGRANWYFMQARHREAVDVAHEAVALAHAVSGDGSRDVEDALVSLAHKQQAHGEQDGALDTLDRAQASIDRAGRGPIDRGARARIAAQRASAQRELRRFDEAARSFDTALAEQRLLYGRRAGAVRTTLAELGNMRFDIGDFAGAIDTLRESLEMTIESRPVPLVEGTATSWLARAHREARHHVESAALYERAAALLTQAVGEQHFIVLRDRGNAGVQQALAGDVDAGLQQARQARQALLQPVHEPQASNIAADLALQMAMPNLMSERHDAAAADLDAFAHEGEALRMRTGRRLAAERIGRAHLALAQGNAAAARTAFEAALQAANEVRRGTADAARVLPEHSLAWMGLAELAWRDDRADASALEAARRDAEAAWRWWSQLAPGSRWEHEAVLWMTLLEDRLAPAGPAAVDPRLAVAVHRLRASPLRRDQRLAAMAQR
jgi:serine/threonine protein kinase